MLRASIIAVLLLAIAGCMPGMPGTVKESRSEFDGAKHIVMEPAHIYRSADMMSMSDFQLGLSWVSTEPENLLFSVILNNEIVNIEPRDGLQFNIDGDIIKLSSPNIGTDFDTQRLGATAMMVSTSRKDFLADRSLLEQLLSSDSVKVKLVTRKGYLEGDFKADKPSSAIRGFRDFAAKLPR